MSSAHPARFSKEVIAVVREILLAEYPDGLGRPIVHDPFAGTGERLHDLCLSIDEFGFPHSGTEIEECFIDGSTGVIQGNSIFADTYPPARFPNEVATAGWVVFTSPVYANGMADNHKPRDASKRKMYRAAKIQITGDPDAALHHDNMGNYGYRGTKRDGNSVRRIKFWEIADLAMAHWSTANLVLLNVSDFKSGGEIEPHVDDWARLLHRHGWTEQTHVPVGTQRMGFGENRDERVEHEVVIVARRAS